jgi:hypothetical protein
LFIFLLTFDTYFVFCVYLASQNKLWSMLLRYVLMCSLSYLKFEDKNNCLGCKCKLGALLYKFFWIRENVGGTNKHRLGSVWKIALFSLFCFNLPIWCWHTSWQLDLKLRMEQFSSATENISSWKDIYFLVDFISGNFFVGKILVKTNPFCT